MQKNGPAIKGCPSIRRFPLDGGGGVFHSREEDVVSAAFGAPVTQALQLLPLLFFGSCRFSYLLFLSWAQIVSGWGGKDTTEVVYPDIVDMKYVWRFFGR